MYAGGNQIIQASQPGTNVMLSPLNSSWNIGKVTSGPYAGEDRFQLAGPPKGFAAGGFISGPGGPRSDMIPAMLSNGEYVVKASSVAKYGRMFASGGMVGSAPMPAFSMPEMADTSIGVNNTNYAGNSSSTRNNTKVQVVINGSGGKSANAIANKVISMINSANNRRNHSRSI
jgi:hypothetical protein